ncbi:hypothetical protein [Candidatus Riesia pediculicola]|uniref:hypothetical protein n=1 Tax=Candidatus Riesia pediculicola TaxID=401619 RepID=UPI0009E40056|nr:hypothetical protein [Candidatus Riesia pediculicola]
MLEGYENLRTSSEGLGGRRRVGQGGWMLGRDFLLRHPSDEKSKVSRSTLIDRNLLRFFFFWNLVTEI